MALNLVPIHYGNDDFIRNALAIYGAINRGRALNQDLKEKQIRDQYLPQTLQEQNEMAQANLAQMPYRNKLMAAQALSTESKAHLAPLEGLVQAQNAMTQAARQQSTAGRFGHQYFLARFLSSAPQSVRANWIAENPGAYQQLLNTIGNQALSQSSQPGRSAQNQVLTENAVKSFFPHISFGEQGPSFDAAGGVAPISHPVTSTMPERAAQFSTHMGDLKKMQNIANLQALKDSTDAGVRQKALYSTNIEKTFNQIDPAFSLFSGPAGKARALREAVNVASGGRPTKEYSQYLTAVRTQMPILQEQIGKFFGGSVVPSAVKERMSVINNPSIWVNSPEIAMQNYNALKKLMASEGKTYRQALTSPGVFTAPPKQTARAKITMPLSRVSVIDKNGNRGTIPASQLQQALKEGYTRG